MMIQILFIFCAMFNYRAPLKDKVDSRCYEEDYVRAWVYFTDKGVDADNYDKAINTIRTQMNKSSIERRMLRGGIIDYADIPLYEDYLNEVEARGGILIKRSKWLNAASFMITKEDLDEIAKLDFIYRITKVGGFKGPGDVEIALQDSAVYGLTYKQLNMFNIDKVHEKSIFGSNVKVGVLDTGLRRKHTALNNIKVVAEYDFLGGDQIFSENDLVTTKYGTYSDMIFYKTDSRLDLFVSGDTAVNFQPVRDVLYTYSTDNGNTWTPLENVTNNSPGYWARVEDVCGQDTLFIFYTNRYGIKYILYSNTVPAGAGNITGFGYREPSGVQISDTVYLFYHNIDTLYLAKGDISGFGSEIIIDSSTSNIKNPEAVMGTNEIGVFYHTLPQNSIYFLKSPLPANENTFAKDTFVQGKDIETISYGDTIFLIWKDTSNEPLFRVAFAKSNNFGDSFGSTIFLSDNLNSIGKISIAKFDNKITVIWETNGKIYLKNSFDNGNSFGSLDSLNKEFVYLPTLGTNDQDIIKIYCQRGDSITDDYLPDDEDYFHPRHGTEMVGLIGGYLSSHYVGVAPGVQFLIAKTENPTNPGYEFPIEEDTWVSGLEWLESHGADIASSSLGYTGWYIWPDEYNGYTSPASIAANEAKKRGMIIVNAAGNVTAPQIVIPGDAEGVITVGGIDTLFNRWQNSGYFPTENHTVKKPEIMCLSKAPIVVNPDTSDAYLYSIGTSGATAMTAGICALLLEGHPNWTVDSVRNALFNTASFASSPTDSMGYGWLDALAAFNYSPPGVDTIPGSVFLTPYPNPFILSLHNNIYLPFKLNQSSAAELRIYSITGRLIKKDERVGLLLPGRYTDEDPQSPNAAFIWDGKDDDGDEVGSGVYYCLLLTHGAGNDLIKFAVVR